MNIDLPFAAFALESSGATVQSRLQRHTLTLRLARPALESSYASPPMSGRAWIEAVLQPSDSSLRAAVLPADDSGLTITF